MAKDLGQEASESRLRETLEQKREINELLGSLVERQQLLQKLSKIQASISHRKPLQEVLDAITLGASELLGDEVVGLRLEDPKDSRYALVVSTQGVSGELAGNIRRAPIEEGAGGRAMLEDRLVVVTDYSHSERGIHALKEQGLEAAMAAPVRENGRAIGSLVVATYRADRTYKESEKEALLALAEHCSLAIADAKVVEAMRDAEHAREMFLALVAHELKTPLVVIMGTLHLLMKQHDKLPSESRADLLATATGRCEELQKLIDRLLQGARAEVSDIETYAYLPELVADTLRGFDHSSRLDVGHIPELNLMVHATAIHRILGMLVENALAHSQGSSSIRIGAELDRQEVVLWVENEANISLADPEELFEPFRRGVGATSTGVGLGLYIARRIAKAMSGEIIADVQDGKIRFSLRFSLQERGPASFGSRLT
ncbi:MAG: GAF domain-containing protein [Actinobacteria bacterium]|nr:GAF domain-containing protein [Actinomycetota bacterium]